MGGVYLDSVAENETRVDDSNIAQVHGQFYDLHRTFRTDRWGTGQLDNISFNRLGETGFGPIRSWACRRNVPDLFFHCVVDLLGVLHLDDEK